jgi:hemolysin activation/secretion protein
MDFLGQPAARALRGLAEGLAFAAALASVPLAAAEPPPSFRELEEQGATLGAIRIVTGNIFDPTIPGEDIAPYRFLNRIHVVTRPDVVERMLLFRSGERVSVRLINETERLLRAQRSIHDVEIRPTAVRGDVVDVEVMTRDTWTLDLTGSFSSAGGNDKSSFGILERTLLGLGVLVGYAHTSNVDRSGTELEAGYDQAFDGWTKLRYRRGSFSDGERTTYDIDRGFYAFDTRWAGRLLRDDDDRIDPIFNSGNKTYEYRHRAKLGDVWGGWSTGLVNGFAHRWMVGATMRDDAYALEPGRTPPPQLPVDHQVRGPMLRYELAEDDYIKVKNFRRIQQTEFLGLGIDAHAQVTRALPSWGSTREDWLYAAAVSGGLTVRGGTHALGQANVERKIASTAVPITQAGARAQLYVPTGRSWLFYASLAGDRLGDGGGMADELVIGGDEGLRGYPSRYQSGRNRMLATLEQRYYTDWYIFRLVRVGAAAFVDVGRAWKTVNENKDNPGWLTDVGVGLRLAIDRAASDNVFHLDVAVPVNRTPDIKSVQFLVKTQFGF